MILIVVGFVIITLTNMETVPFCINWHHHLLLQKLVKFVTKGIIGKNLKKLKFAGEGFPSQFWGVLCYKSCSWTSISVEVGNISLHLTS